MKYIIGLVGENGSGKDSFVKFFQQAAKPHTIAKVRFSDVLVATLKIWGIEASRSNLQNLTIIMEKQFGAGSLTRATEAFIKNQNADIVIAAGMRWKTDVPMIRSFSNSKIVYITADAKVRFERMRMRGEKIGESDKSFEQFAEEEKAATEIEIPQIGRLADVKIENNGTKDEFEKKVSDFYKTLK